MADEQSPERLIDKLKAKTPGAKETASGPTVGDTVTYLVSCGDNRALFDEAMRVPVDDNGNPVAFTLERLEEARKQLARKAKITSLDLKTGRATLEVEGLSAPVDRERDDKGTQPGTWKP